MTTVTYIYRPRVRGSAASRGTLPPTTRSHFWPLVVGPKNPSPSRDGILHVCRSHLTMNLLVKFPGIPEEGSTLTTYDRECDVETQFCRTPLHVWEIHCPECRATGRVPVVRKRKSRIMSTCPRCSGLGFVRYVSARDIAEDDSEGFSLMRSSQAARRTAKKQQKRTERIDVYIPYTCIETNRRVAESPSRRVAIIIVVIS